MFCSQINKYYIITYTYTYKRDLKLIAKTIKIVKKVLTCLTQCNLLISF